MVERYAPVRSCSLCAVTRITPDVVCALYRRQKNIWRTCFQRHVEKGEKMDHSVSPIYQHHIIEVNMSYAIEGSVDSTRKKFSILATRQSSGRSSEISWVLLQSLKWDPCFKQVIAKLPQVKVSKAKLFPFVAGTNRHCCFFTCMGDLLTLNTKKFHVPPDQEPHWLFPWLKSLERPGTKIGRMLKACQPVQTDRTKLRVVKSLPVDATAQGIRKGAVNQLAAVMPGEFAIAATGHDLTNTSKFYEYICSHMSRWYNLLPTSCQIGDHPPSAL